MSDLLSSSNIRWVRLWITLVTVLIVVGAILLLVRLHPPGRLVLAAGPGDGSYVRIAQKFQAILARDGIKVTILETAGSAENVDLIAGGDADAAILQGGIPVPDTGLEAIGAIFFEPMIFLTHKGVQIPPNPALWKDLRISSGQQGSGTIAAYRDFETTVGLDPADNTHIELSYTDSVNALTAQEIDMAVFVSQIDAPYLVEAFGRTEIHHLPLDYTEAISRRLEYANTVIMPAGALSLLPVIPDASEKLLALEARLTVRSDLHPALVNRLTMAAIELHGSRDVITDPGTFPSVEGVGLPVNNAARQLILNGPSAWHDWLPYWMAAQVNRMFLLLLPILFVVVPLLRAVPMLYAYFMRWRVWQHYPEIRGIEEELAGVDGDLGLEEMDARLAQLDLRLSQLRLPAAYRQTAYDARLHIELVRGQIADMRTVATAAT